VLRAAAEDRLVDIIEMADRRTYWDGRNIRDPIDALLHLQAKQAVGEARIRRALT
jgi:hypothetical protein